jgi:RNA polymerase sigma factor (sigma-70 family)
MNLEDVDIALTTDDERLLVVDEALERLSAEDTQAAELIKLRFFAGLNMSEIAKAMGMSERSAHRTWAFARAWLYDELSNGLPGS